MIKVRPRKIERTGRRNLKSYAKLLNAHHSPSNSVELKCIGSIKALLGFQVKRFGRVLGPFAVGGG